MDLSHLRDVYRISNFNTRYLIDFCELFLDDQKKSNRQIIRKMSALIANYNTFNSWISKIYLLDFKLAILQWASKTGFSPSVRVLCSIVKTYFKNVSVNKLFFMHKVIYGSYIFKAFERKILTQSKIGFVIRCQQSTEQSADSRM